MKVGFIGLGKLGLPCAESMASSYDVTGYDIFSPWDPWETSTTDRNPLLSQGYNSISEAKYNLLNPMSTQQRVTSGEYLVDPAIEAGQPTLAELIKKRGEYVEATSAPYKQQLYGMMSYGNPNLESDYFNAAIPQIQQSYRQASGMQNRLAGATGVNLDQAEQTLLGRMNALKQEETIGSAAKQIKQRLKERDLTSALGTTGASNEIINQAY